MLTAGMGCWRCLNRTNVVTAQGSPKSQVNICCLNAPKHKGFEPASPVVPPQEGSVRNPLHRVEDCLEWQSLGVVGHHLELLIEAALQTTSPPNEVLAVSGTCAAAASWKPRKISRASPAMSPVSQLQLNCTSRNSRISWLLPARPSAFTIRYFKKVLQNTP